VYGRPKIRKVDSVQVLDFGEGFTVPASGSFAVPTGGSTPYDLELSYEYEEATGRFEVIELVARVVPFPRKRVGRLVWGEPINGPGLRQIPIERLLREHLVAEVMPEGPPVDDDELVRVAKVYRLAFLAHDNTAQAVARALDIPVQTATKKIMAARAEGLLPPTTKGKAGVV
jgi:hypothetical protein